MQALHPLATSLNDVLLRDVSAVFALLSEKGREAYFPVHGVLSQGAQADGTRINASIGIALEDDGTAMRLPSIAKRIDLPPNDVFPYVGAYGKKTLREEWQKQQRMKNPSLHTATSLPVVTDGLTHALSILGYLFLDAGDEILLPEPYWDNYSLTFVAPTGAKLRPFPLFVGGGFNVEGLRGALAECGDKCVLFLNFPNNPTGYTPTVNEARAIVECVRERAERGGTTLVILDDAYFGLVYENDIFRESLFAPLSKLHERVLAVKVDGGTKEDYAWGLRVGFLTYAGKGMSDAALHALEDKTAGVVRGTASNASHLSQSLLLEALRSPTYAAEKSQKFDLLQSRYSTMKRLLTVARADDLFTMLPCNSGYFLCLELAIDLDAEEVRQLLLREYDTGVISLGNLLRIAFSSVPEAQMPELIENIVSACRTLSSHQSSQAPRRGARAHAS